MKNKMSPIEAVDLIEKKLFDNRPKPYTEEDAQIDNAWDIICLLYTSPSPRDS